MRDDGKVLASKDPWRFCAFPWTLTPNQAGVRAWSAHIAEEVPAFYLESGDRTFPRRCVAFKVWSIAGRPELLVLPSGQNFLPINRLVAVSILISDRNFE